MKTRADLLALLAMMLAGAAQAQSPQEEPPREQWSHDRSPYYVDGDRLLEYCGGGDDLSKGACSGYVAGAIDMIAAMNLARRRVLVCIPPEVELKQVTGIVVSRLLDHPELRRYAATGQIIVALGEAFPCDSDRQGARPPKQAEQPQQPDQQVEPPAEQPDQANPPDQPEQSEQPEQLQQPEHPPEPGRAEDQELLDHRERPDRTEPPDWGRWPP